MEEIKKNTMKFTDEQQAAIDFPGHCLVTANAGSGKTQIFSARFVNTAVKLKDARKIVAITFTEKAASELYNKIAKEIDKRIDNEDTSEEDRDTLFKLRRQLISAQISTIHSFCSGILKKFPVKAGLDANFTPIDQRVSKELIEKSIEEVIKEALSAETPNSRQEDVKYLIRIFGSKQKLSEEIMRLINNRTDVFDLKEIYSGTKEEIAQGFAHKFDTLAKELFPPDKIKRFYENLSLINGTVLDRINTLPPAQKEAPKAKYDKIDGVLASFVNGISTVDDLYNFIRELDKTGSITDSHTLRSPGYTNNNYVKSRVADNISEFNSFMELAFKFSYPENRVEVELKLAEFGKRLFDLFSICNGRYEKKKKENSFVDFEDILLKARKIIEDEEVYSALRKEFQYIMIDEYQDTNELQYNLFLPILDRLNQGNLFVVGDEKQSIYMFRNADLKIFNRTKDEIVDAEGMEAKKVLPHSFRMAAPNCLFTNVLFERLFGDSSSDPEILKGKYNEVGNTPLKCGVGKDPVGRVEIMLYEEKDEDETNKEADMIAKKILLLLGDESFPLPAKDIAKEPEALDFRHMAVLCRKRKSFTALEKAFVQYDIPYSIVGGQGFYQKQVVKDVYNYLAFLVNRLDDAALTGLLRSPFFSVPDTLIFEISHLKGYSFWEKLETSGKLKEVVWKIKENINVAQRCEIPALLRKLLSETPFISAAASRKNGSQELANIEKLIGVADNFSSKGFVTLFDFVDFLSESIEDEYKEGQAAVITDDNAVKIMTLHQSKGLEFPVVFLFNSHHTPLDDRIMKKKVTINKEFGLISTVPGSTFFETYQSAPINGMHNYIQSKKEIAEDKRLFYVGVTRAANYLGISGSFKFNDDNECNFSERSFMRFLEEGLLQGRKFTELLSAVKPDPIKVSGKLEYLKDKEISELEIEIPVITSIKDPSKDRSNNQTETVAPRLNLGSVADYYESEEVITASKYAAFAADPADYYEKHVLGLKDSKKYVPEGKSNGSSDSKQETAALKGTVTHEILARDIKESELTLELVNEIVDNEGGFFFGDNEEEKIKFSNEIIAGVKKFYSSCTYKELCSHKDYVNEFDAYYYNEEHRFYMHGLIDKLIFNGDELVIVDYKTNDKRIEGLKDLAKDYFHQLRFYAVLAGRRFPEAKSFKLQIIFTKFPEENFVLQCSREEVDQCEKNISDMVIKLRTNKFFN